MHVRFDAFQPAMSPILIPAGCTFMRGCDARFPFPSDRPAYLTHSLEVARGYAERPGHVLAHVETTRSLRVLDVRLVCAVLRLVFAERSRVDDDSTAAICTTTLAYGLSSLSAQIGLFRTRYREALDARDATLSASVRAMQDYMAAARSDFPVEVPGIRIAETTNDAEALLVLRQLLKGVDGYIAPRTSSAFHVAQGGFVPAELVLFDPSAAGIRRMDADEVARLQHHDVRPMELVTMPGAHSEMHPVNDEALYGTDLVWMRGGARSRAKGRAKGRARKAPKRSKRRDPFDPCGIDRIPQADYERMCERAMNAAEAFDSSRFRLSTATPGYDVWGAPTTAAARGGSPMRRAASNTLFNTLFAPMVASGLQTNILERMTDAEYEAFKSVRFGQP